MNEKIRIFIPTRDRIEKQITWDKLTPKLREITALVVLPEEVEAHRAKGRNVIERPRGTNIAETRQFISVVAKSPFLMLDDDLSFFKRKEPSAWNLKKCEGGYCSSIMALS